mmetsp:Transcript_13987/g.31261  ORF Transcript_13987/g.31261 Transcript_13987/m.31261 type:complete len:200 (+) Transcript_13987:1105-1704(+)
MDAESLGIPWRRGRGLPLEGRALLRQLCELAVGADLPLRGRGRRSQCADRSVQRRRLQPGGVDPPERAPTQIRRRGLLGGGLCGHKRLGDAGDSVAQSSGPCCHRSHRLRHERVVDGGSRPAWSESSLDAELDACTAALPLGHGVLGGRDHADSCMARFSDEERGPYVLRANRNLSRSLDAVCCLGGGGHDCRHRPGWS